MEQKPTIIEAVESQKFFKPLFKNLESWKSWMTFFKAFYALKMDEEEIELYSKCTSRKRLPEEPFDEAYCIVGRRGGKSWISALLAVYSALFGNWKKNLAPGESVYIFAIATDRVQAKQIIEYCRGILSLFPDMIQDDLSWELRLKNRVIITVKTANFRAGRGFSTAMIILDELAFFRSEDTANPVDEIVTSLLPGLLPNGLLIGISTPYGKFGYLYETYKTNFGKDDSEILVWQAPTKVMNPFYSDKLIERMRKRDPSKAKAEYDAQFREDLETYISEAVYNSLVDEGVPMRIYDSNNRYFAFCDPSGGKSDSFTLGIAHLADGKIILDRAEERKSPCNPEQVTKEFSEILKGFKIRKVTGDKYAGEWVSSAFRKNGIEYETSELSASDLYLEFLALANMGQVRLLDSERAKTQFLRLERKTRTGGKRDVVSHPAGLHDDVCNSISGVSVLGNRQLSSGVSDEAMYSRLPRIVTKDYPSPFRKTEAKKLILNGAKNGTDPPSWVWETISEFFSKEEFDELEEKIKEIQNEQ